MHVRRPLAATGLLLATGAGALGLASPAAAQTAVCDAYSTTCPTPAPDGDGDGSTDTDGGGGGGTSIDGNGGGTARPATLPFTGGEVVLLSAVGVGALVGGTALVVAGRRKAGPTAA